MLLRTHLSYVMHAAACRLIRVVLSNMAKKQGTVQQSALVCKL